MTVENLEEDPPNGVRYVGKTVESRGGNIDSFGEAKTASSLLQIAGY